MKINKLSNLRKACLLLQIGLAVVFIYAAVSQLKNPNDWTTYLPTFLIKSFSAITLVKILAIYEIVLAAWLISGKYLRLAGLLSALTFGGIILFNLQYLIVTFRDIGLLFMSLALVFISD